MGVLKTYTIATAVTIGKVYPSALAKEIATTAHVTGFDGVITKNGSLEILGTTLANEVALDALVLAHGSPQYKDEKNNAIDVRTEQLIALGYEYPPATGKMLSLSENAQLNLLGMDMTRNDPLFVYPVTMSTMDDTDTVVLANATDVHNLYLTALAAKRGHLDSGTVLKDSVRTAADKAAVDAVVDAR